MKIETKREILGFVWSEDYDNEKGHAQYFVVKRGPKYSILVLSRHMLADDKEDEMTLGEYKQKEFDRASLFLRLYFLVGAEERRRLRDDIDYALAHAETDMARDMHQRKIAIMDELDEIGRLKR